MNEAKNIRVGFLVGPDNWLGGRNYLRNLFAAIDTLHGNPITPILITGTRHGDVYADFPGVELIQTTVLDRKSLAWFAGKIAAKTISQDIMLRWLLRRNEISVLSHSFRLDSQTGAKTIGWIPDFQHVHLPEFFTPEARRLRDREYASLCARCDRVIVSSECAAADLRAFAPEQAHKAELLRFVASPMPLDHATSLPELQQLYGFQGRYFLLPNQFWAHKNHRVVLRALQILKRRNEPLVVLATGSTEDHRNPSFFPSLMHYAAECDVLDCFRALGQIPFDHLVGLMQHAAALINPSRFEGWSTSVEEAKSMGKSIVLSDLPVHREQAPERGFFFPAEDPEALAETMTAAYNKFDAQHDAAMQERARAQFPERQRKFGLDYAAIVKRVSDHHDSTP